MIDKISLKRLGLKEVEPDIIGRSYEYLIRKAPWFALYCKLVD